MKPFLAATLFLFVVSSVHADMLLDHEVVLDEQGRLLPWTTYEHVIRGSMEYIKQCPTVRTRHGEDPWFLVTSKLNPDGTFRRNQNNQGSNAYYAVETLRRYLERTGDQEAIIPVRILLERIRMYHTPEDWAWPGTPRTQDDSPDGHYGDLWSDVDKMCMVGLAYLHFADLVKDDSYRAAALGIADTVSRHVVPGDEHHSPLPFRVNMKTGEILDAYTAGMVYPVRFFECLAHAFPEQADRFQNIRDTLWNWVLACPMKTQCWSGYYEDVKTNHENMNQQIPLETARYMLEHMPDNPAYAEHVPMLLDWVRNRFGQTRQHGAVSIREQDGCFFEMSSHTARFASVTAGWQHYCEEHGLLDAEKRACLREEARAALALCTYSTWSRHSSGACALNYVGIGYLDPWFSDSYFDFLPHIMDTLTLLDLPWKDTAEEGHDKP